MYSPFVTFVIYHAALFSNNDVEGSAKEDLTPELIDASVTFVEAAARSEQNMTKKSLLQCTWHLCDCGEYTTGTWAYMAGGWRKFY